MSRLHCLRAILALLVTALPLAGCASYATPGRAADLKEVGLTPEARQRLSDPEVRFAMDTKPAAVFPAAIASARIQAPGYQPKTVQTFGQGAFVVVISRDVETSEHFERLTRMPLVHGVAPLNRLLLPDSFKSDRDLRAAAARLHADMLLIYTFDTVFEANDKAAPLTVVTLGLFPTHNVHLATVVSAVLMDTRTGYIYGIAEATHRDDTRASAWSATSAVEESRLACEARAFDKLVCELERMWAGVVKQHAAPRADAR
jgi:hypothetical protein